jgi:biotin carboxyl carrier protein
MKYITAVDGVDFEVEILDDGNVSVNGTIYEVDFEEVSGQSVFTLIVDGKSYEAHVNLDEDEWQVLIRGTMYMADVVDEREKRLREAAGEVSGGTGEYVLKSPMPGLVVKVPVKVGDSVETGDVLVILESMKMQNELKAPQEGVVSEVNIQEGDSVEQKEIMLKLKPPEEN